jgi:AcrR family transcriptional regulator
MKNGRITIGSIRRNEIVDAAAAIIAEQGIQHLSLSEIETRVGMSRGQLMYYFKAKEDILLAVFDRLLELICKQNAEAEFDRLDWLEIVKQVMLLVLQDPPAHPEFSALQHTFLSQISHRDDFRRKLAELYEEWRSRSATALKRDLRKRPAVRQVSPRTLATLVQAIFHGLAVQRAADPRSINTRAVVLLCLDMLSVYLWNGRAKQKRAGRRNTRRRAANNGKEVPHERNGKQRAGQTSAK